MKRVWLFVVSSGMTAVFAVLGSFVGHTIVHRATADLASGHTFVVAGALIGGIVGAVAFAYLARRLGLVTPERLWPTAPGTGVGFLLAAFIAVKTLSSPIGPLLSTLLVGIGALVGVGWRSADPGS